VCKSNENTLIMIAAKSLPLYVKRIRSIFLILMFCYFSATSQIANSATEEIKNSIQKIVIDAGHGGRDSGALGKKSQEKDITLKMALKLGKYIEENIKDVEIIYTRKTDVYLGLKERTKIANDNEADLIISIHVNSNPKSSPYGTSTHLMGFDQKDTNLDVAIRENSVIMLEEDYETKYQGFQPTSIESYIIFSVMANTFQKQSIEFASYVQNEFRERAKRKDRGVKQQPLYVLAHSSMPGVLIETGFLSNPEEEKFLMTDAGQDLIVSAIYRAFKQYKSRIEENSNFAVAPVVSEPEKSSTILTEERVEHKTDEIVFLIQIASSKNLVTTEPSSFKGYTDVRVYEYGRWYKYAVGSKLTYHDALERCTTVKSDFPGAFVIAVRNNKIIPLSEALLEINK